MSTSTDGGLTWSVPIRTDGNDKGLGGQPLVQPSGRVIVPFESLNGTISSFSSGNGGSSWSRASTVSHIASIATRAGSARARCRAEIAADGRVFGA
jgi:hypothetical protein